MTKKNKPEDENKDEFYFVHVTYNTDEKSIYSTAYVTPPDSDMCANINYIDVPEDCRGKGIASKLLQAVEKWCLDRGTTLIRLDNDTDINPTTGLPSTLYERAGYHYIYPMIYDQNSGKNKLNGSEMEKVLIIDGKHSSECFLNEGKVTKEEKNIEGSNKKKKEKIDEMRKIFNSSDINVKNIIGNINQRVTRSQTAKRRKVEEMSFKRSKNSVRRRNKTSKRKVNSTKKKSIRSRNKTSKRKVNKALITRIKSK